MANQGNSQGGKRGFAAMDANRQREIASMGGKAAHLSGHAHEFNSEEAAMAGRKGGKAAHSAGNAHKFDSAEAAEAGRKGGQARGNRQSSSEQALPEKNLSEQELPRIE